MSKCSGNFSFNFKHFDILWTSNGTFLLKVIPVSSFKKNFVKKAFRHYEWRNPPRGPCLIISTGELPQATCPTRQLHRRHPSKN